MGNFLQFRGTTIFNEIIAMLSLFVGIFVVAFLTWDSLKDSTIGKPSNEEQAKDGK